jgi:PAS domain S-box-containing protein
MGFAIAGISGIILNTIPWMSGLAIMALLLLTLSLGLLFWFCRKSLAEQIRLNGLLQESREKLRSTLMSISDLVFTLDRQGHVIDYFQPGDGAELYAPPEEFLGKHYTAVIPESVGEKFTAAFEQSDGRAHASEIDYPLEMAGRTQWYSARVSQRRDQQGAIIGTTVVIRNISQRIETEQKLIDSRKRFQSLFDSVHEAIFVADVETGFLLDANLSAARLLGRPVDEIIGMHQSELHSEQDVELARKLFREYSTLPDEFTVELGVRRQDGVQVPVEISASVAIWDDRTVLVGLFRNITERKQNQEALHRREQELAHAGRLSVLGEITAGITHEITQPIYAIGNFSSACRNYLERRARDDLGELPGWIDSIGQCVDTVKEIVGRISGYAGQKTLEHESFSLRAVLDDVVKMLGFELRRGGVSVDFQQVPEVMVNATEVQIKEVFTNLIYNACEAFEAAGIQDARLIIRAEVIGGTCHFYVEDNGPGVKLERKDQIFDSFFSTKRAGTGLGLAICRTIVEAHGGKIGVRRNRQRGITIYWTLPL